MYLTLHVIKFFYLCYLFFYSHNIAVFDDQQLALVCYIFLHFILYNSMLFQI